MTEVPMERVVENERTTWATKFMEAVAEIARLKAIGEALTGKVQTLTRELDEERMRVEEGEMRLHEARAQIDGLEAALVSRQPEDDEEDVQIEIDGKVVAKRLPDRLGSDET